MNEESGILLTTATIVLTGPLSVKVILLLPLWLTSKIALK